jgi:probable rRNA maturation factor
LFKNVADEQLEVSLQNLERVPELNESAAGEWLDGLVRELAPRATAVGVRFVDDEEMTQFNHCFRNLEKPTDVLSFPGESPPLEGYVGDIVISVPTARRQAEENGHGIEREIHLLMLHGVLHCLGWDHEKDDGAMKRLEDRMRDRWLE